MKIIQKILVVLVLVTMSLSLSIFASEKDVSNDEILNAAKRYFQVVPIRKMMDDSISAATQSMQPEERNDFIAFMDEVLRVYEIEKMAIGSMVKIFTVEEINALADFYGSDLGQSIMIKNRVFMAEVIPAVKQEIIRAVQQLQKEGKLQ